MQSRRVLLLTDSVALPREKPEICLYEETWPQLLKTEFPNILQVSLGGGTSLDLLKQVEYHKCFRPDVVIVQVGIVDCAPRFLTKFELSLLKKIYYFGNVLIHLLNRKWIKKVRKISYVNSDDFKKNINSISNAFEGKDVYFLGIVPADENYERILPGIKRRISIYNEILKQQKKFINLENLDLHGIMSDCHHLNSFGHQEIYNQIKNQIDA